MAKIGKRILTYTGSTSTATVLPFSDAFMVDANGTLAFTPRENIATLPAEDGSAQYADEEVAIPVLAGVEYSIDIGKVNIAGSTTTAQIWIIRGMNH